MMPWYFLLAALGSFVLGAVAGGVFVLWVTLPELAGTDDNLRNMLLRDED